MPFPFRKKRKADDSTAPLDIQTTTISSSSIPDTTNQTTTPQQQNDMSQNNNQQNNSSPLLMMREEPKKKQPGLSKSSSYSFISWLTPRKKTQSSTSINNTSLTEHSTTTTTITSDDEDHNVVQSSPITPTTTNKTKSPSSSFFSSTSNGRNSKLTSSHSTNYILDHVGRQKSSSTLMTLSLTPPVVGDTLLQQQYRMKKRAVKSEKTPRTCTSPTSGDEDEQLGVKHSLSTLSDEKSPRLVLSTTNDNVQELVFGSIISDCESDTFCFSPLVDETSPFQETTNNKTTTSTSILSDDQAEKDEFDIFEDWPKRFDSSGTTIPDPTTTIATGSSLSTTQLSTTKKKSASSSFSKLFSVVSHLDPFVHIHHTPSQHNNKAKVKSLSPKSATTNDLLFNNSTAVLVDDDTDLTGGALIINDEPVQDRGRLSRSFKNLMMGKKSPVNAALSSLSPRNQHDKSPPPHHQQQQQLQQQVVQHSRLLVVLPDEIKSLIFEFAEFRDILSLRSVCKELNGITDDDRFWQRVCFECSLDFSHVTYKHLKALFMENQLHVTLVGDEGVGKSLLVRRFSNNPAYILESFARGGKKQLYDSMYIQDEEPYYIYFKEYNKVDKSHKKTSHKEDVHFVCFSILDKKSLSRTKKWIKALRAKDITKPIILVGLKVDLRDEEGSDQFKLIKTEQGEQFKNRFKLFSYREVSNKTRTGLSELMRDAINAKRIQTEKFYNYDKTLGTEAEMEDISEDVFNYSDDDDIMDGEAFSSGTLPAASSTTAVVSASSSTTTMSRTATLSKRLSQMKIKDSFVLD